jgi:AcrR family transcriptional regulator
MSAQTTALRTDAEKNRLAILTTAHRVFAERGTSVRLDDIAREAGVGIATLYRRYPQRDDLVVAVLGEAMTAWADRAAVDAARAATEPWQALSSFVLSTLERQAADRAFGDVSIAPSTGWAVFVDEHRRVRRSLERMVDRARAANLVRDDLDASDVELLLLAHAGVLRGRNTGAVDAGHRLSCFVLDGFRVKTSPPLPRLTSGQ